MDGFDIAAARKRRGVSQLELAERMGLKQTDLIGIERNRVPLTATLTSDLLARIEEIATEKSEAAVA